MSDTKQLRVRRLSFQRRSLSMGHLRHHNHSLSLSLEDSDFEDGYVSEDLELDHQRRRKGNRRTEEENLFLKMPINHDRNAISKKFPVSMMSTQLHNNDSTQHFIREINREPGSSVLDIVEDEDYIGTLSNINSPTITEYYSCIDAEPVENNEAIKGTSPSYKKVMLKWIFVISNLVIEILSAIFQQLSSPHNSGYALVGMLTSFTASVICISEIIYKCRQEKVTWRRRGRIYWFYYPPPSHKSFGSFKDIVGLVCAIFQFIFATISYTFYHRHVNDPIKLSIFSVIFAFVLLCSTVFNSE